MTETQKARAEGFAVSLDYRGVTLQFGTPPVEVRALVEPIIESEGEYAVNPYERELSRVAILRTDVPVGVKIGSIFTDAAAATTHRVTEIHDHPTDILVRFVCETAPKA